MALLPKVSLADTVSVCRSGRRLRRAEQYVDGPAKSYSPSAPHIVRDTPRTPSSAATPAGTHHPTPHTGTYRHLSPSRDFRHTPGARPRPRPTHTPPAPSHSRSLRSPPPISHLAAFFPKSWHETNR